MSYMALADEGHRANSRGQQPPVFQLNTGGGSRFFLYEDHLRLDDTIMHYKEMTGISYHISNGTTGSYAVHVLPAATHTLKFVSLSDSIEFEIHPYEAIQNERDQSDTEKLMGLLYQRIHQLVKPYVVINQLLHYWSAQTLNICNIELSARGIVTRNVWGQSNTLVWERYDRAEIRDNSLYLLRAEDAGAAGEFFFCSTNEMNAFVLPDILNYLRSCRGQIDQHSRDKIAARLVQCGC